MEPVSGDSIVRASWAGTAVYVATAAAAVAKPRPFSGPATVVAVALFSAGVLLCVWALVRGAARSRTDDVNVPGLYFLSGTAPAPVRRSLLGSLALQSIVAVTAAAMRPYTTQA